MVVRVWGLLRARSQKAEDKQLGALVTCPMHTKSNSSHGLPDGNRQ